MDSLLKHVVDMTGQRDRAMLDISVIAAVQELADAARARLLAITVQSGQPVLRPRASIVKGGRACLDDTAEGMPGEPVAAWPALARCLAGYGSSATARRGDGMQIVWLPIWVGDEATACLELSGHDAFSSAAVRTALGIVGVYRNCQNLLDYSERDSLTGLLNRKTFDDQLARMLHHAQPQPGRLPGQAERRRHGGVAAHTEKQWLAVVDVDYFKAVNDRFGHLYGDEVLILIANLMQSSFRTQDRVFRFGGEEFVVLLRSSTLDDAWKIIERFRTSVEAHAFPQVGRVTVSIGFVSIGTHDSPVVTLGQADQALYYAKSNGRNQVCHYDDLIAHGMVPAIASNDTAEFF